MTSEQMRLALIAIHELVVQARFQAFDAGANSVAELLDDIELLPVYLAESRKAEFDEMINSIVEKHPECRYVLDRFCEPLAAH